MQLVTNQHAIYCQKVNTDETVCEKCEFYPKCDHETQEDVAKLSIAALEKQIPKKPNKEDDNATKGLVPDDLCPNCGVNLLTTGIISRKKMNYCMYCGQALDWSENEQ